MNNNINPVHYNQGEIQCIDAIESALSQEEYIGFLRGQIFKYNWRIRLKGYSTEDCYKMMWYNERLIKVLEHSGI